MKFVDWQKTAIYKHNHNIDDVEQPIMLYFEGLYLIRVDHPDGTWMLHLGRDSFIDDLLSLEKKLYKYGLDEGIFEKHEYTFKELEEILDFTSQYKCLLSLDGCRTKIIVKIEDDNPLIIEGFKLKDCIYKAILYMDFKQYGDQNG